MNASSNRLLRIGCQFTVVKNMYKLDSFCIVCLKNDKIYKNLLEEHCNMTILNKLKLCFGDVVYNDTHSFICLNCCQELQRAFELKVMLDVNQIRLKKFLLQPAQICNKIADSEQLCTRGEKVYNGYPVTEISEVSHGEKCASVQNVENIEKICPGIENADMLHSVFIKEEVNSEDENGFVDKLTDTLTTEDFVEGKLEEGKTKVAVVKEEEIEENFCRKNGVVGEETMKYENDESSETLVENLDNVKDEEVQFSDEDTECTSEEDSERSSDGQPLKCKICSKTFTQKCNLNVHLREHTGVKRYHCSQCNKQFTRNSTLKSHLSLHNGAKPYNCNQCHKLFSFKSNLNRHMAVHTDLRPYSCKSCDKNFRQKSHLQEHMTVHTGLKAFSCEKCQKHFSLKSNLNKHMIVHSGRRVI